MLPVLVSPRMIDQLTGAHKLTQAQAETFIGAATADYCPGKHSPNKP